MTIGLDHVMDRPEKSRGPFPFPDTTRILFYENIRVSYNVEYARLTSDLCGWKVVSEYCPLPLVGNWVGLCNGGSVNVDSVFVIATVL